MASRNDGPRAYSDRMATARVDEVRRLAQYRPFDRGGLDLQAVLHDLVVALAALNDGTVGSLLHCRKDFQDVWGLVVEVDELRPVFERLVTQGSAKKHGKGIRLSSTVLAELKSRADESEQTEARAMKEWEAEVRRMQPGLSDEDMAALRADLRQWLEAIIARHGAEAAMMLYPEQDRARRFFAAVDGRAFESLPERADELAALRERALPTFIRASTPDQRQHLANLLNTGFYMTVLTIDPAARELVQEQLRGRRIYLDTNFLYAILGAARAEEVYSARRLLELTRGLGFELAVTPWTMNELRTSIAGSRREIEKHGQEGLIRPQYAATMLGTSSEKGFNRYFWQTYRDKQTKPKDFFDHLEHFDRTLSERYGIKEVGEGCTAIEQQAERIQKYAGLLHQLRWPWTKEQVVVEHDVKSRLLVERLRGNGHMRFSNARFWFLTQDTKLPRFAEKVPDNGDQPSELPFCISPSAWVQVARALTPRTEDFDRTVVDLLASPFVGYGGAVDQSVVSEVVGRMDDLEDASPELALAVLTDTAKVREIEAMTAQDDEERVGQTVRTAYSEKARELQEAANASEYRASASQEQAEQAAAAQQAAEARAQRAEQASEEGQKRLDGLGRELEAQRSERARETDDLEAELAQARGDRDRVENEAADRIQAIEDRFDQADVRRRGRRRRIGAGIGLVLFGVALAVLLPTLFVRGTGAVIGALVGGAAFVFLGVRVIAGSKWGGEIAKWLGPLFGLGGMVTALVLGLGG